MPHLTELIQAANGPFHTLEFFPPRTEPGLVNLLDRIRRFTSGSAPPLAVSITWGAGGSTAERSLDLAAQVVELGVEVILHLTCTNMPRDKVDMALTRARGLGIHNILALRGDPPRPEEYALTPPSEPDFFQHADDLVRYIRAEHGDYFCIGVAGYPTPHQDSQSMEDDLKWFKLKCDAGADFIVTQLFYDVHGFESWVRRCRDAGITQPIIPGIMPIQNFSSFRRLVNLTGCPVPNSILSHLYPIKTDDAAVKQYGARLATQMVSRLMASGLVQGVHFCTLNLEKSVRTIVENLGWAAPAAPSPEHHNRVIEEATGQLSNLSISPSEASHLAQIGLHRSPQTKPLNPPNLEDSWDEYPNGRFTDVRSPAYGEIDGWGSGIKTTSARALEAWGTPTCHNDIGNLFTAYINNDPSLPSPPTTPFSDLPLSAESSSIIPHLLKLNAKRYYTVGSQPSVDAAASEDPIHGWGPRGGYVFQKSFVEFFVPLSEVQRLEASVSKRITMYAANKKGEFRTNTEPGAVNAVTWGVFPGQEIVQSTIIEATSFMAWKEEAFDIWTDWSMLYPRGSEARNLLDTIASEWWLVSLIHHDYKDAAALWRFLETE
ncbi:putative methylenetetrahydrofolate reductase [Kockovaella imperatae]|uniref:Putative methylenetetrahydrofolate reductase n=1 Tax=Kockovaella imperatae TaxID=4999 RepID=A0A1Y1USX6_9TREE|nr:putative methylenetetrahydrofolate reductase [Kockovaella imperatae]ORX41123.1 putative methylenetetrahydrofolate reductase [Kockovaella imperatae]